MPELKKRLEGQRRKVQTNPDLDPEIWMHIVEISKKDGGSVRFSPHHFALRDVCFCIELEISGTKSELAGLVATMGAEKVLGRMRIDEDKKLAMAAKVTKAVHGVTRAARKVSPIEPTAFRKVRVDVTVDLTKENEGQKVGIKVKDFHTDVKLAEKVLTNDKLRKFVENTLSEKASEAASRKQGLLIYRLRAKAAASKCCCCLVGLLPAPGEHAASWSWLDALGARRAGWSRASPAGGARRGLRERVSRGLGKLTARARDSARKPFVRRGVPQKPPQDFAD